MYSKKHLVRGVILIEQMIPAFTATPAGWNRWYLKSIKKFTKDKHEKNPSQEKIFQVIKWVFHPEDSKN